MIDWALRPMRDFVLIPMARTNKGGVPRISRMGWLSTTIVEPTDVAGFVLSTTNDVGSSPNKKMEGQPPHAFAIRTWVSLVSSP